MTKKNFSFSKLWKSGCSAVLSCAMVASMLPAFSVPAAAAEDELLKAGSIAVESSNVTRKEPFASGTGGSQYFRIPAFISLENGSLLAAADARWETSGDGGGLDTIASVSSDNGETWNYSFPIYFPDSKGYAGNQATTVIDPALVQAADGTIYCIADTNPTGVTTMGGFTMPGTGTGYVKVTKDGVTTDRLALTSNYSNASVRPTDSNTTTYEYYVGDFDDNGYAPILKRADHSASGYGVDEWFNLYTLEDGEYVANLTQSQVNTSTQIQQNVFYKGSKLHVYNTGYLLMVESKDNGKTWENPTVLNTQIKRDDGEKALLVSPGQGLTTSSGDILIPFYQHGKGDESASFIYSTDNGESWKRTNDVTGTWSSESEVVELYDGVLRMFFRNGTGRMCYADAVKGENGEYTMGQAVQTSISVTSTCNVTAITYSKLINGKKAVMVACPTAGSSRAAGKIFTFLVDKDNSMELYTSFAVPESAGGYCYSCMSELKDGSIGLLWEPNHQSILYDSFSILEVAPGADVSDLEVNVVLKEGESWSRTYTRANGGQITEAADSAVATVDVKTEESDALALFNHISNVASNMDSFAAESNAGISLEDAEFTITAADGENTYSVYNSAKKVYLTNETSASAFFSSDEVNKMKIVPTAGSSTFRICKASGDRYVVFFFKNMDFNANGAYNASFSNGDYELVLLEKQENISDSDVIPGYARVSEVTSGKNYLISYIWTDGKVVVLYPENGTSAQTKLVGKDSNVRTTVTIQGAALGTTKTVIDGVTYNITVAENKEVIELELDETYIIEGTKEYTVTPSDVKGLGIVGETVPKWTMYDHIADVDSSLTAFSDTANASLDLEKADLTFTASGEAWTIKNEDTNTYLTNTNATTYFNSDAADMFLQPTQNEDGTVTFKIANGSSYSTDSRHMCFFFTKTLFDGMSAYTTDFNGSYEFVLLEKQDSVSDTDIIPGYARASAITDGKKYLITYLLDNRVIVLYPTNGTANQTKLYGGVEDVDRIVVTAEEPGAKATIVAAGEVYDITVLPCRHVNITTEGAVKATCEEKGFTGRKICSRCGEVVEESEEIAALGHRWDNGKITTPVTNTTDGVKTYTCRNDRSHTYTEVIPAVDYVKTNLTKECEEAAEKLTQTDVYTADSLAALQTVYDAQKAVLENEASDLAALNAALEALQKAENALVTIAADAENKLDQKVAEVKDVYEAGQKNYSAESWNAFAEAYQKAVAARENADTPAEELGRLLVNLEAAKNALKPAEVKVAAPSIKSVKASTASKGIVITVTVNKVNGADKYAVYRLVNKKAVLVGTTKSGGVSVKDTKLTSTKASYYAFALSADGKIISDKGSAKTITMAKAMKIKNASSVSKGISLKWAKNKNAVKYAIYRSTSKKSGYKRIATVSKKKLTYLDKRVKKGKTYYYKIAVRTKKQVSLLSKSAKKVKRK